MYVSLLSVDKFGCCRWVQITSHLENRMFGWGLGFNSRSRFKCFWTEYLCIWNPFVMYCAQYLVKESLLIVIVQNCTQLLCCHGAQNTVRNEKNLDGAVVLGETVIPARFAFRCRSNYIFGVSELIKKCH